jgi:hypothetical protein
VGHVADELLLPQWGTFLAPAFSLVGGKLGGGAHPMGNDQIERIDSAIPKLRRACDSEFKIMADEGRAGTAGSEAWQNARSNLDGNMQHLAALMRLRLELCADHAAGRMQSLPVPTGIDGRPGGSKAADQAKAGFAPPAY